MIFTKQSDPRLIRDLSDAQARYLVLGRLQRLRRLRREYEAQLNDDGKWLLARAEFSCYVDLRALGLERVARDVLEAA